MSKKQQQPSITVKDKITGTVEATVGGISKTLTSGNVAQRAISGFWLFLIATTIALSINLFFFRDSISDYLKRQSELESRLKQASTNWEQFIIIGRKVEEKLKENISSLRATRLIVARFHDSKIDFSLVDNSGGNFVTAVHWFPNTSINDNNRRLKEINIGFFAPNQDLAQQNKCWAVPKLNQNETTHRFWLDRGSKSIITCPIRDLNLNQIGMLIVENDIQADESEFLVIEERAGRIALTLGGLMVVTDVIRER